MKKLLSTMLCLAITICSMGTAYAETNIAGFVFPSAEEQLENMEEQGYSAEEIAVAESKLFSSYSGTFGNPNARVDNQLPITVYQQELWFYCTPAAMRSILRYLNSGFTGSQDSIALAVGTNQWIGGTNDLESVRSYLNANQGQNIYVSKTKSSLNTYKGDAYTAIYTYGAPMLTNISTEISSTKWPAYDDTGTTGHTVVVCGVSYDAFTSYIGDPIAGTNFDNLSDFSDVPQKYSVSSETVYKCLLGYMY